jgi:DNA-directed RNA polymerase specialized sigma24 family protein
MAEVARRVGCSRDAAYKRVQRALKLLRERYAGREDRLDHEEKS